VTGGWFEHVHKRLTTDPVIGSTLSPTTLREASRLRKAPRPVGWLISAALARMRIYGRRVA
jgi:hypothetical protein